MNPLTNIATKVVRQLLGSAVLWLVANGYLTDAQGSHVLLVLATLLVTLAAHYGNYYLTKLKREISKQSAPHVDDGEINAAAWSELIDRIQAVFTLKGDKNDSDKK